MNFLNKKKENPIVGPPSIETMYRIEQVVDKSAETLVLKNGHSIRGIIFTEGDRYLVFSPDGGFEFDSEDVLGITI